MTDTADLRCAIQFHRDCFSPQNVDSTMSKLVQCDQLYSQVAPILLSIANNMESSNHCKPMDDISASLPFCWHHKFSCQMDEYYHSNYDWSNHCLQPPKIPKCETFHLKIDSHFLCDHFWIALHFGPMYFLSEIYSSFRIQ